MAKEIVKDAVLKVVKEESENNGVVTLSTGFSAEIRAVTPSLILRVRASIKDPEIPVRFNEAKQREEPNEHDPEYQAKLSEVNEQRTEAITDAITMFGVELVKDEYYFKKFNDKSWIKKLKRVGIIEIDETDEDELEYLFKKYIVVSNTDIAQILRKSGISGEAVDKTFR